MPLRRMIRIFPTLISFFVITIMSATTNHVVSSHALKRVQPYKVPQWAKGFLQKEPQGRIRMANLPTPLYELHHYPNNNNNNNNNSSSSILKKLEQKGIRLFVKRDDMTGGVELGGNKIRKLEFLLADALQQKCDSVVTIGGEQSNHCRATAAAARMVGLQPNLILRTKRADAIHKGGDNNEQQDLGLVGNVLFDRMVGSTIFTCTPGEYGRLGSNELVRRVCHHLASSSSHIPYGIPVGGSNGLGSWGYIEGVDELLEQWRELQQEESPPPTLDHILCACGSGGTTAGIALGIALAHGALDPATTSTQKMPKVHAVGVCDSPDAFYRDVATIAQDMGLQLPTFQETEDFIRQHLCLYQGKGLGYAVSTKEELEFVSQFALETGIALDPVYSGKALYNFVEKVLSDDPNKEFEGKNILFWHTGGALGLYEKDADLLPKIQQVSPVHRLDVYGKDDMKGGVDISGSS